MGRSALVEVVDGIYSDMVDMVIHKRHNQISS
jgi:hypothetical protein